MSIRQLFLRRLADDRRGMAAIEFAFVSLALIMFVLGSIEIVILMQGSSITQSAATTTARVVMTNTATTTSQAIALAQNIVSQSGYSTSQISFTANTAACPSVASTQCMTITGTYTHIFRLGFFGRASVNISDIAVAPLIS